jgi:hypothetical protein
MMARRFESGFDLVERCQRELPPLADYFAEGSAMRAALNEMVEAARKVDDLLRHSNEPASDREILRVEP